MAFFRTRSRVDVAGLSADDAEALQAATADVADHPHDLRLRRVLADLCVRLERPAQAIEHYQAIAGGFAAQGLLFRAIAVCKTILALDPNHTETTTTLARLYAAREAQGVRALAEADTAAVLSRTMGAALAPGRPPPDDDDDGVSDADELGVAADDDISDADDLGVASDDDTDSDVIDADILAAVTVQPEGSITLQRPQSVPLFSGLSPTSFADLVGSLRCWEADAGAIIVAEGEPGTSVFVIARGAVVVERAGPDGPISLGTLTAGDFFGEIAIVVERPRGATVTATRRTQLLEIDRSALEDLCTKDPHVRDTLEGFCTRRLIEGTVRTSPLFVGLDDDALARTLMRFEATTVGAGTMLIEQGQPSPGLVVVLAGAVDVVAAADIGVVRLKQLGAGDVFGEMGLVNEAPAIARCVTAQPSRLAMLSAETFASMQEEFPVLRERLQRLTESRTAFNERFLPTDVARRGSI